MTDAAEESVAGLNVSRETFAKLREFEALVRRWNSATGKTDQERLVANLGKESTMWEPGTANLLATGTPSPTIFTPG